LSAQSGWNERKRFTTWKILKKNYLLKENNNVGLKKIGCHNDITYFLAFLFLFTPKAIFFFLIFDNLRHISLPYSLTTQNKVATTKVDCEKFSWNVNQTKKMKKKRREPLKFLRLFILHPPPSTNFLCRRRSVDSFHFASEIYFYLL
jgi:hypothetical protein